MSSLNIPTKAAPTVQSVPKEEANLRELSENDILKNASIIAKPLGVPQFLDVQLNDPDFVPRWVNRRGQEGAWYERMRAAGFINCAPEDIKGGLAPELHFKDGAIIYSDTILMKIRKIDYYGALKYNVIKSQNLVKRETLHKTAMAESKKSIAQDGIPTEYLAGRVGFFTPSAADAEKLVNS